ncbi:glycoside hydrolase family 64 protein [Baudoinia panamericana UAMH 10762]|uniref:Glycoside hydrolase family 64 protein n=1 Tax=Baudoinia panamericana (strain UAMH 10762) TaxID=717646 RepID=M2LJR7_BAUPA|nr:glycoside hydrolase family 64 protein [Baudoinia panamericana UAMH 10762]EMC94467.1 glycoside hydrolase family 64 protein [Baudoinia panamericana UAMH 10762]
MRGFIRLAALFALTLTTGSLAAPVVKVHPGGVHDIVITSNNTVNATKPAPATSSTGPSRIKAVRDVSTNGQLPLALINNLDGSVNAYVTGLSSNNELVMLQPNGQWYYPTADPSQGTPQPINANIAIPLGPQGSTTNVILPDYISAARVWFAVGELQFFTVYSGASNGPSLVEPSAVNPSDPSAAVNWGFVELTNTEEGGLYANISYVDFVGLVLGMSLLSEDGSTQTALGLQSDAVSVICAALAAQTAQDGQAWDDLCQVDENDNPLRVIAPGDFLSTNPTAFNEYFSEYIDAVWAQYENSPLTIDTQAAAGEVQCTVQNDLLTCAGDNRGYAKPTASDIFGCNSGPFAILDGDNAVHYAVVPRLCAAFDRSTLTLEGGSVQPGLSSADYYQGTPTNHYSHHVHMHSIDGKGYAFAYDDVNPSDDVNQSGVVADASPQVLTVTVGGPSTS